MDQILVHTRISCRSTARSPCTHKAPHTAQEKETKKQADAATEEIKGVCSSWQQGTSSCQELPQLSWLFLDSGLLLLARCNVAKLGQLSSLGLELFHLDPLTVQPWCLLQTSLGRPLLWCATRQSYICHVCSYQAICFAARPKLSQLSHPSPSWHT